MRAFLIFLFVGGSHSGFSQKELTTFILVRHAEKVVDRSKNPALSEEGKKRAVSLMNIFRNTPINAVFSTNFLRTESTVKPLANARSLEVKYYEAFKTAVIDSLLSAHKGQTVLLCGHSNTIPRIANYLTRTNAYKDFSDSDYGNIIIITVSPKREDSMVTWLRF